MTFAIDEGFGRGLNTWHKCSAGLVRCFLQSYRPLNFKYLYNYETFLFARYLLWIKVFH